MKDFKVGGKITISKNETYRIIEIIEKNGKKYYFTCTEQEPIAPKIFERINEDNKVYIYPVEDEEIIKEIATKIIDNNSN